MSEVERQDGRRKRRKLSHHGRSLISSIQDDTPPDHSTGHNFASINVDGGYNHFGDTITINQTVNCGPTGVQSAQAKQYDTLLESLTFQRMDARHANIITALPETCQWVFNHPHFLVWEGHSRDPDHHGFLWLKVSRDVVNRLS